MKRALAVVFLMVATTTPAYSAPLPTCEKVKRDATITKGAQLQCLTSKQSITFESLRGPMIVNFWGSWCAPCLDEVPYLRAFHRKYPKIALIGIDVEEKSAQDGRAFARKYKMTWPHYFDAKGTTRGITGVGVPITLFIDANGKILYKKIGVLKDFRELETLSKKYISQ